MNKIKNRVFASAAVLATLSSVGTAGLTAVSADSQLIPVPQTSFKSTTLKPGQTREFDTTLTYPKAKPKMDIMFVVDRTASMNNPISWVANSIDNLYGKLQDSGISDIQVGVNAFGDMGNGGASFSETGSVQPKMTLNSSSKTDLKNVLTDLSTQPAMGDGGDVQEDAIFAGMKTVAETPWRTDAQHVVVLVTDTTTKEHAETKVGSHQVTMSGMKAQAQQYGVSYALQYIAPGQPTASNVTLDTIASMLGTTKFQSKDENDMNANLANSVVPDKPKEFGYKTKVTATYLSDGAVSNDVDVKVEPGSLTLSPDQTKTIHGYATASENPERGNDTTRVTVEYFVDDQLISEATQTIDYKVETAKDVKVQFVDEKGKKLAADQVVKGGINKVGQKYETKARTIKGYKLTATPKNAKGVLTKEDQTVTYTYKKDVPPLPKTGSNLTTGIFSAIALMAASVLAYFGLNKKEVKD